MNHLISLPRINSMANLVAMRRINQLEASSSQIKNISRIKVYIVIQYLLGIEEYTLKHSEILKYCANKDMCDIKYKGFIQGVNPLTYFDLKQYILDINKSILPGWDIKGNITFSDFESHKDLDPIIYLKTYIKLLNAKSYLESIGVKPIPKLKDYKKVLTNSKGVLLSLVYKTRKEYENFDATMVPVMSETNKVCISAFELLSENILNERL